MNAGKIFYSARIVHLLGRYPAKHCEQCGRRLMPKLYGKAKKLENLKQFEVRRFCSRTCGARATADASSNEDGTGDIAVPAPVLQHDVAVRSSDACELREMIRDALDALRLEPEFFIDESAMQRMQALQYAAIHGRNPPMSPELLQVTP